MSKQKPQGIQKDFYGKAMTNGPELYSYGTKVASIVDGVLLRHWDGYSATTLRHIRAFLMENGLPTMNKKEWEAMPVSE